ncbi:hypothetical protein C0991_008691, partial [Blastosporella zonata]
SRFYTKKEKNNTIYYVKTDNRPKRRHTPHPDFALEDYAEARNAMINKATDNEAAIIHMEATWTVTNTVEKRIWARQIQADLDQAKEVEQGAQDLRERELIQQCHKNEFAAAKERKKNRAKYQDVSEEAPPITAPEIISAYVTTRLHRGQYVKLWYFTNEGMAWGINAGPINKNALTQIVDSDGNISWALTTTTKVAKDVKKDRDLSWEQLLIATPRFLEAIQAADWTNQHQTHTDT